MKWKYFLLLAFVSCNTVKSPFFNPASPHEKYEHALKNAGLMESRLGKLWVEAAQKALDSPVTVFVPFNETGYFSGENPAAAGYVFEVKRGEKIYISLTAEKDTATRLFAELYKVTDEKIELLEPIENLEDTLVQTVKREGRFLVRVQPELLSSMEYTLKIFSGPSLAFPVDSSGKPRIISYWGAGRDAGKRKHEGVDIGATFRTPALAAANGVVFRVGTNRLGGKIVFIRDNETGNSLYYAHLDSQIAVTGQKVRTGDTIGLVGNTGNAIHTPPHLHFGIYTPEGAIDPITFIKPGLSTPPGIVASPGWLNSWRSVSKKTPVYKGGGVKTEQSTLIQPHEPVFIHGISANFYRITTALGIHGYIPATTISQKPLSSNKVAVPLVVFEEPTPSSIPKGKLEPGTSYSIIGKANNFTLITTPHLQGWVQ